MTIIAKYLKFFLVPLLLLVSAYTALAIDERYSAPALRGNQIRQDSSSFVQDTVFFDTDLKPFQTTHTVRNLITFRIDEFANIVIPDLFRVQVQFKVYFKREQGSSWVQDSTGLITLEVLYNKNGSYTNKSIHTFVGGYDAELVIKQVNVITGTLSEFEDVLVLENEILINREYDFSCTDNAITTVNHTDAYVASKGELRVSWAPERSADEYDLEWTWVDLSAENFYKSAGEWDPRKIFTRNATRVSITGEEYFIPLLYDGEGYLFYRVRAVQVKPGGQRIESAWSSGYENGLGEYAFSGHEDSLNWQASTSFAEEGKRKSVVEYFDGSLRGRQTVTKDNTTDTTIVAETLYNYQGRPMIQVMPSPSLSSLIQYTPNFNRAINGVEYEKDLYDGVWEDSCYCTTGAPPMDSLYGASRYYSPANQLVNTGFHKYIPDAEKFPFSEVRYTADNTGRISMQGGVGRPFQIGAEDNGYTHETKYIYGSADQEELDALFGSEVGKASHYFKNMVRDANGQYSVSYVDMHGRTIASALAGKPLANLDTLESNRTQVIVKELLDSNNNIIKGTSIESSKSLVVTKAGDHKFMYSLLPDSISLEDCEEMDVCYDCIYDLEITITDDCNNTSLPGDTALVIKKSNFTLDTICNANVPFPSVNHTVFLNEGVYLVTKKLTVSKQAMDYYRDSIFMRRNTCKTLDQFIQEEKINLLLTLQCEPSCDSCEAAIGDFWEDFYPQYLERLGLPPEDGNYTHANDAMIAYVEATESCAEVCAERGVHKTIRDQMLDDVTPPYGQYANPNSNSVYSILLNDDYKNVTYLDKNQNDILIQLPGQLPASPGTLSEEDFITYFQPAWAESLLTLHPEYCYLEKYLWLSESHDWDVDFNNTETFQDAVSKGYLNPGGFTTTPPGSDFDPNFSYSDPFFTISSATVPQSYKNDLTDSVTSMKFGPGAGDTISLWSLATVMAHCPDGDDDCLDEYRSMTEAFNFGDTCTGELDIAWRYFRELYQQKKREVVYNWMFDNCGFKDIDYNEFHVHFPNPSQLPSEVPGTEAQGTDSLNQFIFDNCASYVQLWWEDLKPCNYDDADTTVIFPLLRQVCREGGDIDHMFGASTVRPSSISTVRSFEQVLKEYDPEKYNATCNVYLISAPLPYESQTLSVYSDKTLYQNPDSCECATIDSWFQQYLENRDNDTSFAAYIYRTTGTRMYDGVLDTLRMACNGQINCRFLKEPLVLPPFLQCGGTSACVDCEQVDSLYQQFVLEFPNVIPRAEDLDSVQQEKNRLFERYMNTHLGFSKQTWEYLAFMDTCDITEPEEEDCNVALMFEGLTTRKKVSIPIQNSRLNLGTGAFTFEALIKPKVTSPFNSILSNRTFSSGPFANGFHFILLNDGNLIIQMEGCYNYTTTTTAGIEVFDGKAHHVAVTRDGDSVSLYLDGIKLPYSLLCDQGTTETPSQRDITSPGPLYIGFDSTGAAPFPTVAFNGWIDDIRIWNIARTNSEVANNIYTVLKPQTGLVGYYRMGSKDTCAQTVIDYSTDNPLERNNGMLGNTSGKESTDPIWLAPAQISYDAADPVGVPNTCDCAPVTENCDTLLAMLDEFYQYGHVPHLDASGADTTYWKVNHGGGPYTVGVPLAEVFKDGIATLPDNYTDTINQWLVDYDFRDSLCFDTTGFTFEARVQLHDSDWVSNGYGANWWISLYGEPSTTGKIIGSFSPLEDRGAAFCVNLNTPNPFCRDVNVPASHFNDWRIIKLEFIGKQFKLYLDTTVVADTILDYHFTKLRWFTVTPFSEKGKIDYIKIYDTTGAVYFYEEFDDALNLAKVAEEAKCTDCETRFTEYFNELNGTSYSFEQIDSIYSASCNINVHPCSDNSVDNLQKVKDDFVNLYYNFGRQYDENGCDIVTWTADYDGSYSDPPEYKDLFNGAMQFPDTLGISPAPIQVDYDFVWRDTACVEKQFSLEFRMRQDYFLYMRLEMWFNQSGEPTKKFYIVFDSASNHWNYAAFYDYGNAANNREHFSITEFKQDYSFWRTLKFEIVDSVLNFYVDGQLLRSLNFPSGINIQKFYGFGLASRGEGQKSLAFDYVKGYDKNGNVFYFDDFNDCHNRSVFADYIRCPKQPCDVAFTEYFNEAMGTSHTYEEIKDLYEARGMPLHLCDSGKRTLTLCGKTEPVFPPVDLHQHSPCDDSTLFAVSRGTLLYEAYRDSLLDNFNVRYLDKCLNARYNETFTVEQPTSEYHYTLYYYDQAGNLVKTVPPSGVDMSKFGWLEDWSDSVEAARNNKELLTPEHGLKTNYRFNTLNTVVAQHSPDGGLSEFWYDRLGRLAVSRNAKQKAAGTSDDNDRQYSYTMYDHLGRITEVGQVTNTSANGALTDLISRNAASLSDWLENISSSKEQITKTVYDLPFEGLIANPNPKQVILQRNLRNRVSYVTYSDAGGDLPNYNNATFYTYDILGNVDTLLQDYGKTDVVANMMNVNGNRYKKIVYKYDLISGKVNMVTYQPGYSDRFYHRYSYDAENRLTLVETSFDSLVWERDARYEYYRHGPLARTVIGEQMVQGMDYAYTLQGWLKGINSTGASIAHDMGGDGQAGGLNQYTARDALGLTLNYFGSEYSPINGSVDPFPDYQSALGQNFRPLYNGNISSTSLFNRKFVESDPNEPVRFYNYRYDQLNRLTALDMFTGYQSGTNTWPGMTPTAMMQERVVYDANGNITKYRRNNWPGAMDSLKYTYYPGTNQLRHIHDSVPANAYGSNPWEFILDVDDQSDPDNYVYDETGNLIEDKAEQITDIKWSVYGKILEISRNSTGKVPVTNIKYTYDAMGNRISKVFDLGGNKRYTWYVRDAQGNLLSTYTADGNGSLASLVVSQTEKHIYGASRLGMYAYGLSMDGGPSDMQFYNTNLFERGRRQYELSNHLGNVLVTLSDKKFGVTSGGSLIDYYEPQMLAGNDYYPFGMLSRVATSFSGTEYRFGFNGKEHDWEVKGWENQVDYGMRIYDPRIGRFLSVDPLTSSYPWYTPYQYAGNKPIWFTDLDGAEENPAEYLYDELKVDMSKAPDVFETKSGRKVKTFVKDGRKYNHAWAWDQVRQNNSELFSAANERRIDKGLAPKADDKIINKFSNFKKFRGQVMEIHHLNHGPTTSYGMPWQLHRGKGFTKWWHTFGKSATKAIVALTTLLTLYDMAMGNPLPEADLLLSPYTDDFWDFHYDATMNQNYKGFIHGAEGNNSSERSRGAFGVYYATDAETMDVLINKQFPDLSKANSTKFIAGGFNSFYKNSTEASDLTNSVITHAIIYYRANGSDKGFQPVGIKPISED